MKRHEPELALRHMVDHAREALRMAEGRTRDDLDRDRQLELSLVRLLEIIGEAANRVPREVQAHLPEIPWAAIVGLRNRLIHGYDSVDLDIVWQIVQEDLAHMIRAFEGPSGN